MVLYRKCISNVFEMLDLCFIFCHKIDRNILVKFIYCEIPTNSTFLHFLLPKLKNMSIICKFFTADLIN